METATRLRALLGSLAAEDGVFGLVGSEDAGPVEDHVYGLVLDAEKEWARYAAEGSEGPAGPADVADALTPVDGEGAVTAMTHLSAGDLVFPGLPRRDREHARRAARRVVELLGRDSAWWTNIELSDQGHGWSPVSRFTFDGVVAGAGNGFVVALLQVGED
ncbi:hypothetical protein [Streptomyces sp. NPDC093970]|uniref:hypothetical protein n=1 Tax=Streptomyces sp. NPDC093970 TaxID=3155076 RepID=UPI003415DE34